MKTSPVRLHLASDESPAGAAVAGDAAAGGTVAAQKCEGGGCAYKNFTLFDWAIVVAMVAVILLILPKDPESAAAAGAR